MWAKEITNVVFLSFLSLFSRINAASCVVNVVQAFKT